MKLQIKALLAASLTSLMLVTGCNTATQPAIDNTQLEAQRNKTYNGSQSSNNGNLMSDLTNSVAATTGLNASSDKKSSDNNMTKETYEDGSSYENSNATADESHRELNFDNTTEKDQSANLDTSKENKNLDVNTSDTDDEDENNSGLLSGILN